MKTETEQLKEELAQEKLISSKTALIAQDLKEENERLKAENKKLNTWEERDKMWLERVRKESFDRDLSKREIDSLKQINSELLEALEGTRCAIYKLLRGNILIDPDNYLDGLDSIIDNAKGKRPIQY